MPEMSVLRKSDLSLYLYLKDTVLKTFVEKEELIPLQLMPELSDLQSYVYTSETTMEPLPTDTGRGWVYFDTVSGTNINNCTPFTSVSGLDGNGNFAWGTPEQSERVIVYETVGGTLNIVSCENYMIDYLDGRIVSSRALETPYVSYYWNYVSTVDEWPVVEASSPPIVVIDIHGTDKAGYQLGGGKKVIRKVDLHVFASDTAERNDLIEQLYDGLYNKSCPLYNFPSGSVLDYDGTFYGRRDVSNPMNKVTYITNRETISNMASLYFDNVTSRHVNLPILISQSGDKILLSDLNAYRSKLSFDLISYDDRNV